MGHSFHYIKYAILKGRMDKGGYGVQIQGG